MGVKQGIVAAVVRQFGHPRVAAGAAAGRAMGHRPSNRQRNSWSSRCSTRADRVLEIGFDRSAVRACWTAQCVEIDPRVEPPTFHDDGGDVVVEVHRVIRDRRGRVLGDGRVGHVYAFRDALVRRMRVRP